MVKKRGGIKENFLKKNLRESYDYVKESRRFIYAVIILFLISVMLGYFFEPNEQIKTIILNTLKELMEKTKDMNATELIQYIFLNNSSTSFIGMFSGIILGIFPFFVCLANGYVLGFAAQLSVNEAGIEVLWRLLPHGIFELPAIFISLGLGLRLGSFIFEKKRVKNLKRYFINSAKTFIFIVLPLLIIAAVIEGSLIALFG